MQKSYLEFLELYTEVLQEWVETYETEYEQNCFNTWRLKR